MIQISHLQNKLRKITPNVCRTLIEYSQFIVNSTDIIDQVNNKAYEYYNSCGFSN